MQSDDQTRAVPPESKKLAEHLQELGLSVEKWLSIFKKELDISTAEALQYVGLEEISILEGLCQHQWEKNALSKLLDKDAKTKQLVPVLPNDSKKFGGKQEKEENVKFDLLTSGKPSNLSAAELFDLDKNKRQQLLPVTNCTAKLQDRGQGFDDAQVLMKASGGRALEGIYFVKSNLEQLLKTRERLLDIPKSFEFSNPAQDFSEQEKETTSRMEEELYLKKQEKLGFNSVNSISAGCISFAGQLSIDVNHSSATGETYHWDKSESYFSIIKSKIVPLQSYFFPLDDMKLSESALKALRKIDKSYSISKEGQCRDFFQRFGTHADQGPLHFGGIFLWKSSSVGFSARETEEVKEWTSNKLNAFLQGKTLTSTNVSADKSISCGNENDDFRHNKEIGYRTDLSVIKRGGPPEANVQQQWIEGLVANKQTWAVIDKGHQLVPIWDIIEKNHQDEFYCTIRLITDLQHAYGTISDESHGNYETYFILRNCVPKWNLSNVEDQLLQILSHLRLPPVEEWRNVEDYIINVAEIITDPHSKEDVLITLGPSKFFVPVVLTFLLKYIELNSNFHCKSKVLELMQKLKVFQKMTFDCFDRQYCFWESKTLQKSTIYFAFRQLNNTYKSHISLMFSLSLDG